MKAKLFTLAVMVLAAGDLGYLLGRSAMKHAWHDSNVKVYEDVRHSDLLHEVSTDTEVLQYLADGNLSKAREVLERERGQNHSMVHSQVEKRPMLWFDPFRSFRWLPVETAIASCLK
jgi:hypothetical protein